MIKVEHTKRHKVTQHYSYYETHSVEPEVLVTDAELVLVLWDRTSLLFKEINSGYEIHNREVLNIARIGHYLNPILISRTEKIEVGDWILLSNGNIVKYEDDQGLKNTLNPKKILALPEHFSHKQLQDIVEGKLKEGKLLVECDIDENIPEPHNCEVIKLNSHITIYPVEEKIYTRERLKELMHKAAIEFSSNSGNHAYDTWSYSDFDKWFEQNVK